MSSGDGAGDTAMGKRMKLRSFESPEDGKATDAVLLKDSKDDVGRMRGYASQRTGAQTKDVVACTRRLQK